VPVDVVYRLESSLEFALTMIVGNCWYWHAHGFLPSPTLERSVSGATRIATRPAPRHNTRERRLAFQFPRRRRILDIPQRLDQARERKGMPVFGEDIARRWIAQVVGSVHSPKPPTDFRVLL